MGEQKVEHLKMIQEVITRMTTNSFLLKGWAITLASALFVLTTKDAARNASQYYILASWLPVIMFGLLDAYYLWQEKLFRKLYDRVRSGASPADMSMSTNQVTGRERPSYWASILSPVISVFYGVLLVILCVVTVILFTLPPP